MGAAPCRAPGWLAARAQVFLSTYRAARGSPQALHHPRVVEGRLGSATGTSSPCVVQGPEGSSQQQAQHWVRLGCNQEGSSPVLQSSLVPALVQGQVTLLSLVHWLGRLLPLRVLHPLAFSRRWD